MNRLTSARSRWPALLAAASLLLTYGSLHAQQRPDAGRLLREQPKPSGVAPAQKGGAVPAMPGGKEADSGPRVLVKGFRIQGAVLIPASELAAQIQSAVGKQLSFRQLEATANDLTGYYARKGYLARVTLPPQDIKDGIVRLIVTEGKRGLVRIDKHGERIDAARVKGFIDRRLQGESAMNILKLDEALNILNEQPGIKARSALAQGKKEGDIDVVVTAEQTPLFSLGLGANNQGSRGVGENQVSANVGLNNPTGSFDAASLVANASDGTSFGRVDYSLAVGDSGLRLGINASDLRYHLTQSNFSALQASGTANSAGLHAVLPLRLHAADVLRVTASYDAKRLVDRTVVGETGNRHVTVGNIGVQGYFRGGLGKLFGGGFTGLGAGITAGDSDQRNAAALAADSTSRRVQGGFSKLSYNASYLQALSANWRINATLRGQAAGKNLDSSEQFMLGGPAGVRAYPTGEAIGDEGWLLSLNLSRALGANLAGNIFLDTGSVRLNRKLWTAWNAANPNLPNRYQLSGVGVGLDWLITPTTLLSFSVAAPVGSNPGRDLNNLNADGSRIRPRAWLSLNSQF